MVTCDRCKKADSSWHMGNGSVLGYSSMCAICHDTVRAILNTVSEQVRAMSETDAVSLVGLAVYIREKALSQSGGSVGTINKKEG